MELLTTVVILHGNGSYTPYAVAYYKQETSKGVYCRELLYCTENTHNTPFMTVYPVQYSASPPEKLRSEVTTAMSMSA